MKKSRNRSIQLLFVDPEEEVMATYDAAVELFRNNTETTNFRVYLRNEELTGSADLLFFSLNFRARHNIS